MVNNSLTAEHLPNIEGPTLLPINLDQCLGGVHPLFNIEGPTLLPVHLDQLTALIHTEAPFEGRTTLHYGIKVTAT